MSISCFPYPSRLRSPCPKNLGRSLRSSGPRSTGLPPAFSITGARSPLQCPGRITRSTPSGTTRCLATHFGGISAATEIGMTATSATNPAPGASASSSLRRANSARRPVTNRERGGGSFDVRPPSENQTPGRPRCSPHRPAVHPHHLPRQELRVRSDQETNRPRHVLGSSPPLHRRLAHHAVLP